MKLEHWNDIPNPDDVEAMLAVLLFGYQTVGPSWGAIASSGIDIKELDELRMKQLAFLGRYARQPVDVITRMQVRDVNALMQSVATMIEDENSSTRASEQ